jgi:predicted DNA binding CopG/RHH family protein
LEVQKILDANPCPIDNEMIKKIENYNMGEYEEDEQQRIEDLYMNWKYGAVYAVTELNLTDTRITEVELDSTNFDLLIRDF